MSGITDKRFDDKKQQIFAAAQCVFSEKGYAAATMNEIAQAVGLAKATLYHYFSSKDQLFAALMEDHFAQFITGAQQQLASVQSLEEIVHTWVVWEIQFLARHQGLIRLFFHGGDEIPPTVCHVVAQRRQDIRMLLTETLRPHLPGHLDVDFAAIFLQGSIKAMVLHLWSTDERVPTDILVTKTYQLLMGGLHQREAVVMERTTKHNDESS